MRRFLFWRVFGFSLLLLLAGGASCGLTLWLPGWLGQQAVGSAPAGWLALLMGAVLLVIAARGLERVASPLGDLIEAAGRVESGDYTARVAEGGPRELRALSRAFNAMAERLQLSETQRRELLAEVTHELRTPVTVIQGNLEALLDGVYPADEAHLAPVLDETHVLSRLIDDLRTLSLAESGALELHREPTDLGALIGELVASFHAQAEASHVDLSLDVPEDLPLLEIDPVRIREVLANLVANALRHTSSGGQVVISASMEDPRRRVAISVRDTGAGIAAEELPHIFDRFYKSGAAAGTGLGLTIAKNLVAAHGGEIAAESSPGEGTTIRFTLPLTQPA